MSCFPWQDLVNAEHRHVQESVVLYYCCEMLSIVAALHQCGIIHADLKPDNFLVKDLR